MPGADETDPRGVSGSNIVGYYDDYDGNSGSFIATLVAPDMAIFVNSLSIITNGDLTPSTDDDTDFGSANINGGSVAQTFWIWNNGSGTLNLTGSPPVQVGGSNSADFIVTSEPSTPIAPNGGYTEFTVVFQPTAMGLRSATITVPNDTTTNNPYVFAIQGTGLAPSISIWGNGLPIPNGEVTVSSNGTDFGDVNISGVVVVHTFTIENTGTAVLHLSDPIVQGSGGFSVVLQPTNAVAVGGFTTFQVAFDPSAVGIRSAMVSVANDDTNNNPYTFAIQGNGISGGGGFYISRGSFFIRTNQFCFTIHGTNDQVVVVEGCTNLANPFWIPLTTNSLTSETNEFCDPELTNYPDRFYRLVSP